jgi:hypothetical protein
MDPEEAQRLIDEETLDLNTRRNTYARISRLPNEVLIEIFATLRVADDEVQLWHHVAYVCRHWRRVAQESATLWTSPPTDLQEYTLLMLERSRTSPLEIEMRSNTFKATWAAILSNIGRIKSLNTSQSRSALNHCQRTLLALAREAPLLKPLVIVQWTWPSRDVFRLSISIFQ